MVAYVSLSHALGLMAFVLFLLEVALEVDSVDVMMIWL